MLLFLYIFFIWLCSEEDGTESLTVTTPRVSTEVDDDQEKRLLSPLAAVSPMSGCGDVTFVKEAHT